MSTRAHEISWYIARNWESYYASAVLAGIVGDRAHALTGGYHMSIQDNRVDNYSVIRIDDKAPPGDWPRDLAAAIDMSMSPSDMALCSGRLWTVWNDTSDPRRVFLNGFNGWFNDGEPAKRYDYVTQRISVTTSDHKSHVHGEIRRRWVTSMVAANAILSILRGETKAQYLASLEDDQMFCNFGDENGKVWVLQAQLNDVLAAMFPDAERLVLDYRYGPKTAQVMLKVGIGNPANDGKIYGPGEFYGLQDKLMRIKAVSSSVSMDLIREVLQALLPNLVITVRP